MTTVTLKCPQCGCEIFTEWDECLPGAQAERLSCGVWCNSCADKRRERVKGIQNEVVAQIGETMNPSESKAYQALVDELAKKCTCTGIDRPCDGLLAGGLC